MVSSPPAGASHLTRQEPPSSVGHCLTPYWGYARCVQASHLSSLEVPPFVPHPLLRGPHAMTIAGRLWPRLRPRTRTRKRVFRVDAETSVLAHIDGELGPTANVLILLHGLTGSAESAYVQGTAAKAVEAALTCVRVNARNCGGTEHLTARSYHGGLTDDVRAVCEELVREDGVRRVTIAGFSIGGNLALKYAAELGGSPPTWFRSVVAVSPCVDFAAAAAMLDSGFFNRIYQRMFLRELRGLVRRQHARHPGAFHLDGLDEVRTIRAFDHRFTAPLGGFDGVDDYYARASSLALLDRIALPTLILAARDDPLVPFGAFERPEVARSPALRLVATEHGGHTAFVGRDCAVANGRTDGDRFWAESRIVQAALHFGTNRAGA